MACPHSGTPELPLDFFQTLVESNFKVLCRFTIPTYYMPWVVFNCDDWDPKTPN